MDRSHRPPIPVRGDDVSGHAFSANEDVEPTEDTKDAEGHTFRFADAERAEDSEDTEGHGRLADAEHAEDADDVQGHVYVHESSPQGGRIGE